jgi:protein-tyrosine-phosphatase
LAGLSGIVAAGNEEEKSRAGHSSVLFMCSMNAVRSPMAEEIAKRILPKSTYVQSAGARKGKPDPFLEIILEEAGMAGAVHEPRALEELEDDFFDLVITLSPEAHHCALELTRAHRVEVEYWPTPDPTTATGTRGQIIDAYRDVFQRLRMRIEARFSENAANYDL